MASVYVVVADGMTCFVPRAATGPMSGSIVNPVGFSVLQTSTTGSPARTEVGRASNVVMRGSGAACPRPRCCACTAIVGMHKPANINPSGILTRNLLNTAIACRMVQTIRDLLAIPPTDCDIFCMQLSAVDRRYSKSEANHATSADRTTNDILLDYFERYSSR